MHVLSPSLCYTGSRKKLAAAVYNGFSEEKYTRVFNGTGRLIITVQLLSKALEMIVLITLHSMAVSSNYFMHWTH